MQSSDRKETRALIVEAAFRLVAQASLDDVLRFVGPTSLAEAAHDLVIEDKRAGVKAPAAETVAYHFHEKGTARKFDIEALAGELLSQACEQIVEAAHIAQVEYLDAAERFADGGTLDAVATAVGKDLANYRPGSDDALVDARERLYFTAVALCDDESAMASQLRETNERTLNAAIPVYERFLALSGRRIVAGFDVRDLAALISMFLEGESLRYRYRASLAEQKIAHAVIRMFWAFTLPQDEVERDIQAELAIPPRPR